MANHFRINEDSEPMITGSYKLDLTRHKEDKVTVATLESLGADKEAQNVAKRSVNVVPGGNIPENAEVFDPTTIIPKKEVRDTGVDEIFGALDAAVEREKQNITKFHEDLEAQMYEDYINKKESEDEEDETPAHPDEDENTKGEKEDLDEDDDFFDYSDDEEEEEEPEINTKLNIVKDEEEEPKEEEPVKKTLSISRNVEVTEETDNFDYDDDELDDDLDDAENAKKESDAEQEAEMEHIAEALKEETKKVIKPKFSLDLSKFKIGTKSIRASKLIIADKSEAPVADWCLYNSGRAIAMSGLTGPELIKLDPQNYNRNRANTLREIYHIIYDHVVDAKKPDFITWMKQTKYSDLDHIYFAMYMATFNSSNFVSYQCPDCKKVFLKEVKFSDMVKYKDDSIKQKVMKMVDQSTDNGLIDYNVDLIQVSDQYVFGIRTPSLYNIIMENASLPDNILEKYADLINTINYIDGVYVIDYVNQELQPVKIPSVPGDAVKSSVKKIKILYSILKKLTSDEFYTLRGHINKIEEVTEDISYFIPAAVCPHCETKIAENTDTTAAAILFTRHHLGAFANM